MTVAHEIKHGIYTETNMKVFEVCGKNFNFDKS